MTKSIKRPLLVGAITAIFLSFTFYGTAIAATSYDVVTVSGFDISSVGITPPNTSGVCSGLSFYLTSPAPALGKTYALYSFPDSVIDFTQIGNYFNSVINDVRNNSAVYTCMPYTNVLISEVDSSGTGNSQVVCFDLGSCSHLDVATIGNRLADVNIIPVVIPDVNVISCSKFIYTDHTSETVCNTSYSPGYTLATNPQSTKTLSQSCIQKVNDYTSYKSVVSESCSVSYVKPPDPANDDCGFELLAPTSWVRCLFIPTDSNFGELKKTYDDFLQKGAVGQVTGIFSNLIFATTQVFSLGSNEAQSKTCLGPNINFMYIPLTGLAHGYIQYSGHPFANCTGFLKDLASNFALPIQYITISFAAITIFTNLILNSLNLGDSLFTRGTSVDKTTVEVTKGWRRKKK